MIHGFDDGESSIILFCCEIDLFRHLLMNDELIVFRGT